MSYRQRAFFFLGTITIFRERQFVAFDKSEEVHLSKSELSNSRLNEERLIIRILQTACYCQHKSYWATPSSFDQSTERRGPFSDAWFPRGNYTNKKIKLCPLTCQSETFCLLKYPHSQCFFTRRPTLATSKPTHSNFFWTLILIKEYFSLDINKSHRGD